MLNNGGGVKVRPGFIGCGALVPLNDDAGGGGPGFNSGLLSITLTYKPGGGSYPGGSCGCAVAKFGATMKAAKIANATNRRRMRAPFPKHNIS